MKRLLLILSVIVFTGTTITAQESVLFAAKAGINFATMTPSESFSDNNTKTGIHLGLLAEIPLSNRFSIQPEVLYAQQGTSAYVIMIGSGPKKTEYKLDYIQLAVLVKIYLTEAISIEAGPLFNFLVNEGIGGEQTDYGSGFEFSGAIGASYKFRGGFFGDVRYIKRFSGALNSENYANTYKNSAF